MFIDFHVDKWVIEALRDSGVDEDGNSTSVGDLEVLHYDMKYTLYSNGGHLGLFGMRSMKIYDRRFNSPNQFKEILTPLGPGVGKLGGMDDKKPPNIVGAWADRNNQWELRYERSPDGFQDMSYSWDHCYFNAVPDAIFDIFDVVKPVIFDDIMPTTEIWRNWRNPDGPAIVVPSEHQSSEFQMKMAITSSEVFLLEDSSNINTQSIVVRSTFSIIFKKDNRKNSRRWVVMVDQMECFKCRISTEDSAVSIMQPLNWSVDYYADDTRNTVLFDLAQLIFYFSYKDYLTTKRIIDNWLPWLSGRQARVRVKPPDDRPSHIIAQSLKKKNDDSNDHTDNNDNNNKDENNNNNNVNTILVNKEPYIDDDDDEEEEEEEEDEDDDDYYAELDPIIKARMEFQSKTPPKKEEVSSSSRDSLIINEEEGGNDDDDDDEDYHYDSHRSNDDKTKIILSDIQNAVDQHKSEERLLLEPKLVINQENTIDQLLEVKTRGFKFILIDDTQHNRNNPLCTIIMDNFNVELTSWSVNMKIHILSKLRIDYYHTQLEVWEPVLEPWFFQFIVSRSPAPAKLSKYQIYASNKCEVNITAAMIETTLNTIEAISNLDDQSSSGEQLTQQLLAPYIIKNETGLPLTYWLSSEEEYLLLELLPDEERSLLDHSAGVQVQRKRHNDEVVLPPSCSLIVQGDYTPVKNIPIEKVGTYITRVSPVDKNAWLACEVSFRTGTKVLSVKSNIQLTNHTLLPLETIALVEYKDSVITHIPAGETISVPLAFASNGTMQIRPKNNYRWNEGELLIFKIHRLKRNRTVSCKLLNQTKPASSINSNSNDHIQQQQQQHQHQHHQDPNFFYYKINLSTSHSGKIHHINVYPPLCLENLLPVIMEFRIINRRTTETLYNSSIPKGEYQFIHSVDPSIPLTLSVKIPCFGWSKAEDINSTTPSEVLQLLDEQQRKLNLRVINLVEFSGMRKISVFAQYWMVNHTGLRLLYRRAGLDSSLAAGQGQLEKKTISLSHHPREWYNNDNEYNEPFLFTTPFYSIDLRGDLAKIKIANSEWSQNINLNSQGTTSFLEIPDNYQDGRITRCFSISMTVSAGTDIFWRTKVVSWYPRFIIINNLENEFIYHQKGCLAHLCSIHPGENIPFHWADKDAPRQICIRINDKGWEWSGGFEISELCSFSLKMRNSKDSALYYLARVRVKIDNASTLVIVSPENNEFPGYKIENQTTKLMKIHQVHSTFTDIIQPKSNIPYAWDKPMAPHKIVISFDGHDEQLEVDLDRLKTYVPIRVGRDRIRVIVSAKGPTKVLSVESTHLQDEISNNNNNENGEDFTDLSTKNSNPIDNTGPEILQSEIQLALQGIGISVIDESPEELSYITLEKIYLTYSNSNFYKNVEFSIGWLQVDNQLYQTPYPVVVYPISETNEINSNVFFDLSATLSNQVSSIMYFKSFTLILQKIDLKLDEEFVLHTMKFYRYLNTFMNKRKQRQQKKEEKEKLENQLSSSLNNSSSNISHNESKNEEPEDDDIQICYDNNNDMVHQDNDNDDGDDSIFSIVPKHTSLSADSVDEILENSIQKKFVNYTPDKVSTLQSKFIYFEVLQIYPIQVNFSFANVPGAIRDQDTMISRILSRGGILANIDSAPLVLGELILLHPFATRSETLDRITKHYISSAIREFHKMLGSADFLGSPISFVRTMGTGFYDFFNEPRKNMDSPYAFGKGVARGTQSLIKNSTWGAFNSAAKFSSTIGKGAAALTFDKPYVRERELLSREKPLHLFQGLAFGLRDFGLGCVQGIGGVVVRCFFFYIFYTFTFYNLFIFYFSMNLFEVPMMIDFLVWLKV